MDKDPQWFNVFESQLQDWLQEDNTWGPYEGAAEFALYEDAHKAAQLAFDRAVAAGKDVTVVVLGDYGAI